jgi:membrane protein DedA with SNARE-associated domain
MIVVFGGYLAGLGRVDLWFVILLATIGGSAGFMTMYGFGHMFGTAVLDPDRFRWLPKERIRKVRLKLREWGYGLVAANRFLSGLRSVISLTVGMAHMNARATLFFATLSALLWTTGLAVVGRLLGRNWQVVRGYLETYGWFITGTIAVFVVIQLIRLRRRRAVRADEDDGSVDV